MDYHDHISIMNLEGTICENLLDIDYGSFKEFYELNEARYINFTAYRTSHNRFVFDLILCENFVIYHGEKYIIKQTSPKVDGQTVSIDVTAYHVMYEFQNHDVESNKLDEESSSSDKVKEYTLDEYLKYGFKNQKIPVKYTYKIIGNFNQKVPIDELGNKNGLEYIKDTVELFGCIIFPNDTEIGFYSEEMFYQRSENVIRYQYNTDTVSATVSTLELRTAIKVYGKKYTAEEKNNYSPIKTPQLKYTGTFIKEGTYRTEVVGAKATISFKCKYGDETIRFTIKKGSQGGLYNLFLDGKKIKQISCYAKTAQSETIDLIKHVEQGAHKLEMVFVGEDPNHPMPEPEVPKSKTAKPKPKLKPCMHVGTEKSTVLNLIASSDGLKAYKAFVDYVSPESSKVYGIRYANTQTNETIDNDEDLKKYAKTQITDTPKTELDVNYISYEAIKHRDTVFFVHELMGYNTELKVVKLDRSHPYANTIDEVSFSNEIKDMVQIQQALNKRITAQDNRFNYQAGVINQMYTRNLSSPFETIDIGSVLV
ncbi:prophage endopeptidase tail family protein [Staphylococcus xylosus]|uniref:prophage endopeptidase tail family protein n=1 Tax=Staphylococcus xylosus TaxID=1288 RepID=UPI002DBB9560|nr:prophage endopeptidase tail family protein [Staphylococcus xylosus]MEB8101060.1 phage tail protein [Staphylococcus xylosus]